jgi:Tol biopolymer transport system component
MVRTSAVIILAVVATLSSSTNADAQYFGRNKVRYDPLDFRLLQTEHFDLYYYAEEEEATVHAARMAERWYARFSRILGHTFTRRQPLILYASHSHFSQTNLIGGFVGEGTGGFTERTKSRIAMPFAPGLGETDHVLGHEIAHAFQIDIARSVKEDAFALPGWFIEGMAEYLSLGPANAHTSMWVRDAAGHDRLPTVKQLNDPRYFPYRYGHALWSHLAARFGDGLIGSVLRGRGRDAVKRIEKATSESAAQLTSAWHESIEEAVPSRAARRAIGGDRPGRMQLGPAISPDGTRVMFLSERDRLSIDLFVADTMSNGEGRKVVSTATDQHFDSLQYINSAGAWDPSGERFAMAAVREGDAVLVLINVADGGREEVHLPHVSQLFNPSWSPDGSQIVVSGLKGGLSDLYIYSVATKALRPLTADPFADVQPAWSPDGATIAFATDRFTSSLDDLRFGPLRIGLLNLHTGVVRPLDDGHSPDSAISSAKEINPQWSPDGRALYYIADREQTSNVYRRTLATGGLVRVTNEQAGVSGITATSPALAVAAQSGTVAFTVFVNGAYRIQLVDGCGDCSLVLAGEAHTPPGPPAPRMAVADALSDPKSGLPQADTFTRLPYDDRLRLETVAQPFIGGGTGNAFGGLVRASFGATFGDLLRDRQLQTLFRVGTDLDDFAAQVAYTTRRGRWNWGITAGFLPARFYGAHRALERGAEATTRETTSLRYDHQWGGLAARYHLNAVRRFDARIGVRRTGFRWQTVTRVTDTAGQIVNHSFVESPAGPALYQAEAQLAFVHDTAIFGPVGPVLGQRLRVEVEPAFGRVPFMDVRVDARRYWMPFRPLTIAARVEHVGRYGSGASDPRLTPLVVGLQTLIRGYDMRTFAADACGRTATVCSVLDELAGSRLALMNLELRAPLIGLLTGEFEYGRQVPIELIAFADGGALWTKNPDGASDQVKFRSFGFGGRANFGGFVVELTAARPIDRTPKGWRVGFLLRPGW